MPGIGINRHMRRHGTIGIGVFMIMEGFFNFWHIVHQLTESNGAAIFCLHRAIHDVKRVYRTVEPVRCRITDMFNQLFDSKQNSRTTHNRRSRVIRAKPLAHISRRAMEQLHLFNRQFQRIGGNLRQHCQHTLPNRRRPNKNMNGAISLKRDLRVLARPRRAAFDKACNGQPVIYSID